MLAIFDNLLKLEFFRGLKQQGQYEKYVKWRDGD